ncbi:MAG TPA: LptF/LptG family permease, partial [Thermosynergistes sp.]|nr:LptF/LptG family permease [Thermosynergistes sp.]
GSSMGVRSRRATSGVGLGVSVIVIFFYYVLMSLCKAMGESGYMPPLFAAWLPNLLFFLIGGALIRRANTA